MDIIEIYNLTFRYKNRFIFDKFSLNIKRGDYLCITGCNGSGKSTLLKLIFGLLDSDDIRVFGKSTKNKDIRKRIGFVLPNTDDMFICETIEDDLIYVLENLYYSKTEIKRKIREISKEFEIRNLLNKNYSELSGGERAKVSLALALICDPEILLLDDSLSMIDEKERENILKLLKDKNDKGLTIISVIYDLRDCYLSNRLIVLNNGEIILDGSPFNVMEYDKVLNRLSISLPFEIELCIKLKLYGLIDYIEPDISKLVNTLWE